MSVASFLSRFCPVVTSFFTTGATFTMAVLKIVIIHPMGIRRHTGHYKSRSIPFFLGAMTIPQFMVLAQLPGLSMSLPISGGSPDIPGSLTPGPSIQSAPSPCAPSSALVGVLEISWGEWGFFNDWFFDQPVFFEKTDSSNHLRSPSFKWNKCGYTLWWSKKWFTDLPIKDCDFP